MKVYAIILNISHVQILGEGKDFKARYFCSIGMVRAMDEGIGNLTNLYKKLGLWDNTLIIFSTGT